MFPSSVFRGSSAQTIALRPRTDPPALRLVARYLAVSATLISGIVDPYPTILTSDSLLLIPKRESNVSHRGLLTSYRFLFESQL